MSGVRETSAPRARRVRRQGRNNAPDEILRRTTMRPTPECLETNGAAIRAARLAKGLTQEALGRRLRLTQVAIWQLEVDRYWVNETMARHIAEVLCAEPITPDMPKREIIAILARASEQWTRFVTGRTASSAA